MIKNDTDRPLYSIEEEDAPLYSIDEGSATIAADHDSDSDSDADLAADSDLDCGANEVSTPGGSNLDPGSDLDCGANEVSTSVGSAADKQASPMRLLFKTMLTPVEGWKALKRARFRTDAFAARCFYPLIALAAFSEVASLFYEANKTFADWATEGLATFVSFFFGYFTVIMLGSWILPKKSRYFLHRDIGRQFVMLNLSTMALFWTLIQAFPMLEPVLVFLPLWTIYLIFKGIRVLRVSADVENSTTGYLCMLIIGVPIFWNWLMTEFLLPAAL